MKLQEGIKIYTKLSLKDRIYLSNGTEIVNTLNDLPCTPNTFVPKEPWREPTEEELSKLTHKNAKDLPYQSIGAIQLPKGIIDSLKKLNIQSQTDTNKIIEIKKSEEYKQIMEKILAYTSSFQRVKEEPIVHNLACLKKGLRTVTFNDKEKRFLGLHLDFWERKPFLEMPEARNRICINIGKDDRFLLYTNIEIKDLMQYTSINRPTTSQYQIIHTFLKENPKYPVVKIRIRPFEAYIAPTENIIHDGCTEGQDIMDIHITLRSYYNVAEKISFFKKVFNFMN